MQDANLHHWIGGQACEPCSTEYFDDFNPEDNSVFARAARGSEEDVSAAVAAAHDAFQNFRTTPVNVRERCLADAAALLQRDQDEFVSILVDEIGSPIGKAHFEVALATDLMRAASGIARQVSGKTLPSDVPGRLSLSTRRPVGVVASITPFNVPLIKGVRLTANPLAMGNTVVHLPSEETPVLALRLAKLYEEAGVPAGAYNVVTGYGYEIGDVLTTHPFVKVVTFTGSTRVGRHIQQLCARHNKRLTLEMGGKSPMVVLKDADLDQAVEGAVHGMFTYQGQICMASSRIYVEEPLFDSFVDKYAAAAGSLGMGDLRDIDTVIGPIISERQRERVRAHVKDAIGKGAKVATGGEWQGNRCSPTVLTGVSESMTLCREETFGPVVAVYPVSSAEEALSRANDTEYGLSASVYTSNIHSAMYLAENLHSGMVHVNAPALQDEPHVPFGGVGDSGWGREGTTEDIEAMTELKWMTFQM